MWRRRGKTSKVKFHVEWCGCHQEWKHWLNVVLNIGRQKKVILWGEREMSGLRAIFHVSIQHGVTILVCTRGRLPVRRHRIFLWHFQNFLLRTCWMCSIVRLSLSTTDDTLNKIISYQSTSIQYITYPQHTQRTFDPQNENIKRVANWSIVTV